MLACACSGCTWKLDYTGIIVKSYGKGEGHYSIGFCVLQGMHVALVAAVSNRGGSRGRGVQ